MQSAACFAHGRLYTSRSAAAAAHSLHCGNASFYSTLLRAGAAFESGSRNYDDARLDSPRLHRKAIGSARAQSSKLGRFPICTFSSNLRLRHRRRFTTSADGNQSSLQHDYHQLYKRAVTARVLSTKEYKSKRQSLISQGLWDEDTFRRFERWLLEKGAAGTTGRWEALREKCMDGVIAREDGTNDAEDTTALAKQMLAAQCSELQSTIFPSPDQGRGGKLASQAFPRMLRFVFNELFDYCQERVASKVVILPTLWSKLKESGAVVETKKVRALLNAAGDHLEQSLKEDLVVYHDMLSGEPLDASAHRLRYSPAVLRRCCEKGDVDEVLSLIRSKKEDAPSSFDHYIPAISTLIEMGHIRNGADAAKLFDEVAGDMSLKMNSIPHSSAVQLHNALSKECSNLYPADSGVISELPERGPSADVPIRRKPAKSNEVLAYRATINASTWTCTLTGKRLRTQSFSEGQRQRMLIEFISLADENAELDKELVEFAGWLRERKGPPFTIFLCEKLADAAGRGARYSASVLEKAMKSLEAEGHTPLLLVPDKYISWSHIPRRMRNSKQVYRVRSLGGNYDLFGMIATVCDQNEQPDMRPVLMINHDFCDHASEMRDPELVRLWYEEHCRTELPQRGEVISPTTSFSRDQRVKMFDDILELACKRTLSAGREINDFVGWLDSRNGPRFTAVLDGANIGAVETMIHHLHQEGEYPLVILPENHHYASQIGWLKNCLKSMGDFYVVPGDHLDDDLFCMIATVSDQKKSSNNQKPGVCPLITNDRFLDHRRKTRDLALFGKWYESSCYRHLQWYDSSAHKVSRIVPSKEFGRRIAESKWGAGTVWHFPVRGWGYYERFVVHLPSNKGDKYNRKNR